jgi:hypothetical protein
VFEALKAETEDNGGAAGTGEEAIGGFSPRDAGDDGVVDFPVIHSWYRGVIRMTIPIRRKANKTRLSIYSA